MLSPLLFEEAKSRPNTPCGEIHVAEGSLKSLNVVHNVDTAYQAGKMSIEILISWHGFNQHKN